MSFASDVKKELLASPPGKDCCKLSMLSGIICFGGKLRENGKICLISSESSELLEFVRDLCTDRFSVSPVISGHGSGYSLSIPDAANMLKELDIIKSGDVKFSLPSCISQPCCKRAFIKGSFLSSGTVSDPKKQNHLEFSTPHFGLSEPLGELLGEFDIPSKLLRRKSRYVTYFKDNDIICDVLAIMGAGRAALTLSETSISKSISNKNNRINNSENANYDKTVIASVKQIIAINNIEKHLGIENLPPQLRELAEIRLKKKDLSLTQLAEILDISKSGVNHRMRKIIEIAENLTGDMSNG